MPSVYWQEFKRWIKAFTRIEVLLAILEGILLVGCIAFLAFLIMHFIVCPPKLDKQSSDTNQPGFEPWSNTTEAEEGADANDTTAPLRPPTSSGAVPPSTQHTHAGTFAPGVKCTWERSRKTAALTHYYEHDKNSTQTTVTFKPQVLTTKAKAVEDVDSLAMDDQSDGEQSRDTFRSALLALVRYTRDDDETFGCTLVAVTEYWALTAASCLEAVEEVDSLDNYVMTERYGDAARGRTHALADVRPHPQFAGRDPRYDLAALRSDAPFRAVNTPRLPDLLDYFLITMGERLSLFGFGPFRWEPNIYGQSSRRPGRNRSRVNLGVLFRRNSELKSHDRRVREVGVYVVPAAQCAGAEAAWARRHLARALALQHGGCGAAPLCAAVLYARGAPCGYCAGAPLLRRGTLLGLMAGARRCGLACEPATYVNVVLVRDWIDMLIGDE
ncbi:uncharacterized protein LOC126382255 [Pectinophora gossypiella]|uniref:uncharacterized protein LOC126382255 n=1 Tax=Pectinophora gossypiella TaxID=13191 RepID=UPI00214E99B5|nr:uncharacterized protein LOC126382255 [Pectinophora gossypiella]